MSTAITVTRTSEMYIATPPYQVADEVRFPQVLTAPGVDLAALMAAHGDTTPVFVTRPLAILGEVSENGLPYNRAIFDDIYRQVLAKRPAARRGHVPEAQRNSAFPPDDGYWIGAVIDDTVYGKPTVFGKNYVVPGDMREMVLSRQATGTPLSNSVWGRISWADNEPIGVNVETIDFVPEERAALKALGGEFVVTSEMSQEGIMTDEEKAAAEITRLNETVAAAKPEALHESLKAAGHAHRLAEMHMKSEGCAECTDTAMREMLSSKMRRSLSEMHLREETTPEETYNLLSPAQRKHVAETHCKEMGLSMSETQVKETAVAEMTTLQTRLSEMETAAKAQEKRLAEMEATTKTQQIIIQRYEREAFEAELDKAVATYFDSYHVVTPKGEEGIANLKSTLRFRALSEMAGMKDGQTAANIKAGAEAAWPHVKPLAEMFIASAGGPSAFVGGMGSAPESREASYGFDPKTGRYTTEAAAAAKSQANW